MGSSATFLWAVTLPGHWGMTMKEGRGSNLPGPLGPLLGCLVSLFWGDLVLLILSSQGPDGHFGAESLAADKPHPLALM